MSTYPGAIDEFRNTTNLPGVEYNAADTATVFAEDTNDHSSAIVAIEQALGVEPTGDFESVADRLNKIWPVGVIFTTTAGDDETPPELPGTWECIASGNLIGASTTYSWERIL